MTDLATPDIDTIVERYLAAWNEPDKARRRALIAEAWTPDARYVDPMQASQGWEGIDGMIAAVQQRFPGFTFRPAGPRDGHNGHIRFGWELFPPGADAAVVAGTDVATLSDGRLHTVIGFLDRVPG